MGYGDSKIDQIRATNPGAPEGTAQVDTAAQGYASGDSAYSNSYIGKKMSAPGASYMDVAQSWYTGANIEGVTNSWNTDWWAEANDYQQEAQQRAAETGDASKFYSWVNRDDATGLVTWNDEKNGLKAGDVYDHGKKVGNLYDQFDRRTANYMLGEYTLDRETKQDIFSDVTDDERMEREMQSVIDEHTKMAGEYRSRAKSERRVEERQEDLLEGKGDEAIIGGTAAGGAAIGAGIGAFFGGIGAVPGAAIGAGVGGAIGGLGGWLNKDQLTHQTARALEVTSEANKRYGPEEAFFVGTKEFAGVGLRMISPTSNVVQGIYDAREGKVGDGKEEFYAIDPDTGQRKPGGWWRAADVGATIVDSLGQFSSGLGIGAYMGLTGAHVAGAVGEMGTIGGSYDDRSGKFHEYETGGQWAAAVGSVGIDVIQMGMAGAIARAGSASRAAFGMSDEPGRITQTLQSVRDRVLPGRVSAGSATTTQTINGRVFQVDTATGEALASRMSFTLLAPSELVRYAPSAMKARAFAAAEGRAGQVTADDFYKGAMAFAGGNRFSASFVNGFAEGMEEATQGVLEPISMDRSIDAGNVIEAFYYGMAAGAGMSLGRISAPATTDEVARYKANVLYEMRHGRALSDGEWDAMSPETKRRYQLADEKEAKDIKAALETLQEALTVKADGKPHALAGFALSDLNSSAFARDLANANPNLDNVLQLAGMSTDMVIGPNGERDGFAFGPNAGVSSAWQMVKNITDLHTGFSEMRADIDKRLSAATAALQEANLEADELQRRADVAARIQAELDAIEGLDGVAATLRAELLSRYEGTRSTNAQEVEDAVASLNQLVADAFNGTTVDPATGQPFDDRTNELLRRSVELKFARHPFIEGGSWVVLMPQASLALSSETNNAGLMTVHQSVLKALGGDRDGDTLVTQDFVSQSQEQLDALRAGAQYLDTTGDEVVVNIDAPDNEKTTIRHLNDAWASNDPSVRSLAADAADSIVTELWDRYENLIDAAPLARLLSTFKTAALEGNPEARLDLINGLHRANTDAMLGLGRANNTPESLWLNQRISLQWDQFLTDYAAHSNDLEFTPEDVFAPLPAEKKFQAERAIVEAATAGQTMAAITSGADPVRTSQKFHYSQLIRSAADSLASGYTGEQFNEFARLYAELGSNIAETETERVESRNRPQRRVARWLEDMATAAKEQLDAASGLDTDVTGVMLLLANMAVADLRVVEPNVYERHEGDITFAQLLMKRSIEIEERTYRAVIDNDVDLQKKLGRLKKLSQRSVDDKNRSTTAQNLLLEVLGDYQIGSLLGDSAKYLGPQLTPKQLVSQLSNLSSESRKAREDTWQRKAPYLLDTHLGNPPYSIQDVTSGRMSGYQVLVDSIITAARTAPRDRRRANDRTLEAFKTGIANLHTTLQSWRRINENLSGRSDVEVLHDFLDRNTREVPGIAALIPDAVKLGAFGLVEGRPHMAPWVAEFLVADPEKAALDYFVNSKLTEWAFLQDRSYSAIKSRMLQTFYALNKQGDGGMEWDRLVLAMRTATSLPQLMERINDEPMWRGDRAELLPFFDDVAAYEVNPRDVWSANLPGSLQREAITAFSARMKILSRSMAEVETELNDEAALLSAMEAYADGKGDRDNASRAYQLLQLAIQNRVTFPDHGGPAARERLMTKIQSGVIRSHDKGKSDEAVAPAGEFIVAADEFGVKSSVAQAIDAVTAYSARDILSNPTLLADGPVRVGLDDHDGGATVLVDFSDPREALRALSNPVTRNFAKQVLFPTVRDVTAGDTLQTLLDTTGTGLKSQLEGETYEHLFVPQGDRLSVAQAHRFIAMVEAGVRKAAIPGSEVERDRAAAPITRMIGEFLVAYSHHAGYKDFDLKAVRDNLVVDVATALQQVTALRMNDPLQLQQVRDLMAATLKQRFLKDNSDLSAFLTSEAGAAAGDVLMLEAYSSMYSRRAAELQAQLADPNLAQAERDELMRQFDEVTTRVEERTSQLKMLQETDTVKAVINMFTLTGNAAVDTQRKAAVLRFLGTSNRLDRVQGNYDLLRRVRTRLAREGYDVANLDSFSVDEWNELGGWAATVYLAELAGRAGSGVDLTPIVLGPEGEAQRRYFDFSWSYLLDGLFNNEAVLDTAERLVTKAKWPVDTLTADDVAGQLEKGLFNYKKLGKWTELVVSESLKSEKTIAGASVGLAIPVGGELPKEIAAYSGAGRPTYELPTPDMLTTIELALPDGLDDLTRFKLNNHFAGAVLLRSTDAQGQEVMLDLLPEVGRYWLGEESVTNSPYRLIDVAAIEAAVEGAIQRGDITGGHMLEISYFDVDTKPYGREWANNVYFDGAGTESVNGLTVGLANEMFFGINAISKRAQQNPLNFATKGGSAYRATPLIPFASAQQIEASTSSVAEVLREKAWLLQRKEYDVGVLHPANINAFYKLLKQRHVVVGMDDYGDKVVLWAEEAIALQAAGEQLPRDAKLVALSDDQARVLLGEPGNKGFPGVVVPQTLNLDDMDVFPALDNARLEQLGLERLGEEVSLAEASAFNVAALQRLTWSGDRKDTGLTRYEARIQQFKGSQMEVRTVRHSRPDSNFNIAEINAKNGEALTRLMGAEALAPILARLNIPYLEARDLRELDISKTLQRHLEAIQQVNPSSIIWQHVHGQAVDTRIGLLSEVATRSNFSAFESEGTKHAMPTYEDIVVIDLDSIENAHGGSTKAALDEAKETVRAYAERGLIVGLTHGKGGVQLRKAVADWINTGALGYAAMAESQHFFAPASTDLSENQTRRSLESTLTATRSFTGDSIIAVHVSDRYGDGTSENAGYRDLRGNQPVFTANAVTLIPTSFDDRFGLPYPGVGQNDQEAEVRARILDFVSNPDGRAHILKMLADPEGVPVYRENENGTIEPGIRDKEAALDRLISLLQANRMPLTRGEELMIGDLIPVVGQGRNAPIVFVRVGFQLPDSGVLEDQINTAPGFDEPLDGETGAGYGFAAGDLQETWTTRPPGIIQDFGPDPLVGLGVKIKYDLAKYGKTVFEGDGMKIVWSPMPNDLAAPVEDLSDNGLRVNFFAGQKASESKQAVTGQVTNWQWAFAFGGIDFRQDMVEYLGAPDWNTAATFLKKVADTDWGMKASDVADILSSGSLMQVLGNDLNQLAVEAFGNGAKLPRFDSPFSAITAQQRLGEVFISSLMAPHIKLDDIISTSGLQSLERLDTGAEIKLMPQLFTDALENFDFPELRMLLVNRVNARLPRRADGSMPYKLKPNWDFEIEMEHPLSGRTERVVGTLQLALEMVADENPVNYVQSNIRSQRQGASQHVAFVTSQAIGGRTTVQRKAKESARLFTETDRFADDVGGFWQMLRAVPESDKSWKPWRQRNHMQRLWIQEAASKVGHYLQRIDQSDWTEADRVEYEALKSRILEALNINQPGNRDEVDYLVRQLFGMPRAHAEDPPEVGRVTGAQAKQAAQMILTNLAKHRIPTYGGMVPLPHQTFLALVHEANAGRPNGWAPAVDKKGKKLASSWPEWTLASIGQVRESNDIFMSVFRQDLDGFWHTYQGSSPELEGLSVSMDELVDLKLMDKDTAEFAASLDPNEDILLSDPIILDTHKATLDALVGKDATYRDEYARASSASELSKRIEVVERWHKKQAMPKQKQQSVKSYMEEGSWYVERSRDTHNFFSNFYNLTIFNRLLNPALWTSAVMEVFVRNTLENVTNIAQGQSSTALGRATRAIAGKAGMEFRFTGEELAKLDALAHSLGDDNRFLAEVYDEMLYRNYIAPGHSKFGKATERMAGWSAKLTSDPHFGMTAKSLGKRYLEAAVEYLYLSGSSVTVDQLVAEMNRDPLWLKKQYEASGPVNQNAHAAVNPHRMGLNRVSQTRSIKATVGGKLLMGVIDNLSTHHKWSYNASGMMLKIPFAFTRFNINALTTMTGLGGWDQWLAMTLHGRDSKFIGRMKAGLSGQPYDPAMNTLDMSDVIEGVDLFRPFIKAGLTHMGLMQLAMAAGGLGLSGEDEESKRRRRQAEWLGTPYYYDPRDAENDWRHADAIFLDGLPGPLSFLGDMYQSVAGQDGEGARASVMPHWTTKMFLSPVMGIERFFSTGDVRQIKWGFEEAFSVMPNSVIRLWQEASLTGDAIEEAMARSENKDTPFASSDWTQLGINLVGIYERALLENAFVNTIRSGSDTFNRNAYKIPAVDKNGQLVMEVSPVNGEMVPVSTDRMGMYRDPETGELKKSYADDRTALSGALHQYAENSLGAATLLSLFSGQWGMDSSYFRQNMVPSTKIIELPPMNRDLAEAMLFNAFIAPKDKDGTGVQPVLTGYELQGIIKKQYEARGEWWEQDVVAAEAEALAKRYEKTLGKYGGLSILDADGREVPTREGAKAVLRGLRKGTIQLGDAALIGYYIPWEMRKEIEVEWAGELVQEGLDLGLDEAMAKSRANRLWWGHNTFEDPTGAGLREILYSDKIPSSGKAEYYQLNTTYTIGPDGMPWATPYARANVLQALGIPLPHRAPLPEQGGLGVDARGNITDSVYGINTGLMALVRKEPAEVNRERRDTDLFGKLTEPSKAHTDAGGTGSGWKNYGYSGWRNFGGSGWRDFGNGSGWQDFGSGGGGSAYFTKMYSMPDNVSPYGNNMPFINTSNPILRRAFIRRERVESQRGRLFQWQ